ncbi:MAG: nucleotidyltransferase [Cyclobacteriaceae bacterium]
MEGSVSNLHALATLNSFARSMYEANPENEAIRIMDITSDDVKSFLLALNTHKVKYMLVGGVATTFHGYVRTTQDLDLWVSEEPENKKNLVEALKTAEVAGADNFINVPLIPGWSSLTIGNQGFEADFMGFLQAFSKEDFDNCYKNAVRGEFEGIAITVIHLNDLITEKKASGRPKDLDDVQNLEKIKNRSKK